MSKTEHFLKFPWGGIDSAPSFCRQLRYGLLSDLFKIECGPPEPVFADIRFPVHDFAGCAILLTLRCLRFESLDDLERYR
jgi:hypothetical protein